MDDNSDAETWDVIRQYEHDARFTIRQHDTTEADRRTTTRYAALINSILPKLNHGYVGYMCDNVEWQPNLVKHVNQFLDDNPEVYAGYVLHERDIWSNGQRKGAADIEGHWNITPPQPNSVYKVAMGLLDHSQVFHRLPCSVMWSEDVKYKSCGDGVFFNRLIIKHGGIHPIANDKILSQEHLIK